MLQQTTTTKTTDANGNVTTTETSTTVLFSTAPGHEGEFVSGNQTSTMTFRDAQGHVTPMASDQAKFSGEWGAAAALAAVGGAAYSQGVSAAIPGALARLPGTVGRDARAHPGKYAGAAVEGAAIATPVPEAYEGAKAVVDVVLAAAHLAWELTH